MPDTNTGNPLKELEELYKNKDYEAYKDLLIKNKSLFIDAQYFYNLGTAYLKLEDLGAARLYLEKSYQLGQQDKLVTNNIDYIKTQYDLGSQEYNLVAKGLNIPSVYYTSITLVLLLIVLVLNWRTKIHKGIIFILFIVSLSPAIFNSIYLKATYNNAVVMKDTQVHEGPSAIFEHNQQAREGLRVIISKVNEGWSFIYWPSSVKGWVKSDSIETY
ncbi:tetratricopeptide repeat protein [Halobacteriovorax sp. YZS-1-1]|uniref:tetratricopeptide repeat protein n=1 Tax=unclassified Halobacteriovorax TaxID=2639665 RepID=UPI00399A5CD7